MPKTKVKPVCAACASHEALFITLGNGEKLPKYTYEVATGNIYCTPCSEARKNK